MGFEPTISAGKQPKTYALDRAATETSYRQSAVLLNISNVVKLMRIVNDRICTRETNEKSIGNFGLKT